MSMPVVWSPAFRRWGARKYDDFENLQRNGKGGSPMRLTLNYPSRIRLDLLIGGAVLLLFLQLASGTQQVYAELVFLFIVLSGVTVNLLGGLSTLGGFCVAAMSLK